MIQRFDSALVWLDRWSAVASRGLYRLGVYFALPLLVSLVSLDVLLRYLFNAPLAWARDANGLILLVCLFSCLPYAWDRGYHIRMEILYAKLSARKRRLADTLTAVSGIAFFGAIGVQGLRFFPYMQATDETGEDLLIPLWPFMAFMALCSLVFAARLLSRPEGDTSPGGRRWL